MRLTDVTGKPSMVRNECPRCSGDPMEITANDDQERRFVCEQCGRRWGKAFVRTDRQPGE